MKSLVSKLNMAASDEVDVVLNQSNTHSESNKAAKPNGPRPNGNRKEMVKLGNTQVNRGSKNVSLRHLFNGLS